MTNSGQRSCAEEFSPTPPASLNPSCGWPWTWSRCSVSSRRRRGAKRIRTAGLYSAMFEYPLLKPGARRRRSYLSRGCDWLGTRDLEWMTTSSSGSEQLASRSSLVQL